MPKWWGYVHTSGSLHVKRYFSQEDIDEADASPFVKKSYGPWECLNSDEAMAFLKIAANIK